MLVKEDVREDVEEDMEDMVGVYSSNSKAVKSIVGGVPSTNEPFVNTCVIANDFVSVEFINKKHMLKSIHALKCVLCWLGLDNDFCLNLIILIRNEFYETQTRKN